MSISRNVGSMARYLAHIRTKPGYLKVKGNVESVVDKIPLIGKRLHRILKKCKNMLKQSLYGNTLFEDLGFTYYGPFDGHDLRKLMDVLENAKKIEHPVLLHILTSKGKGYTFAEKKSGCVSRNFRVQRKNRRNALVRRKLLQCIWKLFV